MKKRGKMVKGRGSNHREMRRGEEKRREFRGWQLGFLRTGFWGQSQDALTI